MIMGHTQVMFFTLIFKMVVLLSLHSTTQPTFIFSSASCAGVPAVAGEVAKDEKHLAAIEKVGLFPW